MIGIYALYWEENDKVYIGQTVNSHDRKLKHESNMKNGNSNYKIMSQYSLHGLPEFIWLETCELSVLNEKEVSWIKEFNSITNGLNITSGGHQTGHGYNSSNSRNSKARILRVFSLLLKTTLTYGEILKKTGVPTHVIQHVCAGRSHHWLQEEYPELFNKMRLHRNLLFKSNNRKIDIKYPDVIDEYGNIYSVTNARAFCIDNPTGKVLTQSSFSKLLRGEAKTSNGFKLAPGAIPHTKSISKDIRPPIMDRHGVIYSDIYSVVEFCKQHEDLKDRPNASAALYQLYKGNIKTYLGFKLVDPIS